MIKSELIKVAGMEILEQEFCGDYIMTARLNENGKIYVGINWVTTALSLTKGQHDRQVKNIQQDLVLSKGASNLTLPTKGGKELLLNNLRL